MREARLLLGSGGLRSEARRALYFEELRHHFDEGAEVVFIPYAGADHAHHTARMAAFSEPSGIRFRGIESFSDPVAAIESATGLYVGGGNTFLLNKGLHENGLIDVVRRRVAEGMPYMGVSAGSNVACPTMQTTNDMPIVMPPSFESFGLIPYQINAHYHAGSIWLLSDEGHTQHFGETRAQRIEEFHQHNATPVIGLCEGTFLRVVEGISTLIGGEATVFRPGAEPVVHTSGTRFDQDLHPLPD